MSIARKIGNLGTALDSAALSTFLSKGTTDGEFDTIAWGDVTGKPSYIDSSLATQLFDSAYVQLRQSAVSSGGLDSAAVTTLIDSNYVAARATAASSSGFVMYNYNATSGQTAFQDSDTAGNVLSYTADGILVYYNGLLLADEDYTATDGSAVTLTEGADSGAQITIGKWNLTGSGSSSGGSSSIAWGGDRAIATNGSVIDYFNMTTTGNSADFGDTTAGRLAKPGILSDKIYGVLAGGYDNIIDYVTIATPGNATDFGNQNPGRGHGLAPMSDGTYGVWAGGRISTPINNIDYVTIASPGNATDFGDLVTAADYASGWSDGTYGYIGGNGANNSTTQIQYITIASPGNASNSGNLSAASRYGAAASDATIAVVAHGETLSATVNTIDYMTMSTSASGSDFGDLTAARKELGACGNGTRVAFIGGVSSNVIDYITVATPANATDFGDLTASMGITACSGDPA